jgi:O-antigen ligase
MTYRGILTFSRGGVLTSAIMSIVFLILYFYYTNIKSKVSSLFKLLGVISVIAFIWFLTIMQTGGLIENRYTNKDALGREKEDVSSGRLDIANTEINAFFENPFFGVGVGQMKFIRTDLTGEASASHNEVSRLLSEHGMFGIFSLLILILTPVINNPFGEKNIYFYPLLLFWFLTINHSAMRIAAPAFIYGLSLITIKREKKNTLHRK